MSFVPQWSHIWLMLHQPIGSICTICIEQTLVSLRKSRARIQKVSQRSNLQGLLGYHSISFFLLPIWQLFLCLHYNQSIHPGKLITHQKTTINNWPRWKPNPIVSNIQASAYLRNIKYFYRMLDREGSRKSHVLLDCALRKGKHRLEKDCFLERLLPASF